MFCSREKLIGLKITQQNEKSTQKLSYDVLSELCINKMDIFHLKQIAHKW